MGLKDYGIRLQKLREEREKFLELLHASDRKLARGEITKYQRNFTINSITSGLTEKEYLRSLEAEINEQERLASIERSKSPAMHNILKVSLGLLGIILVLLLLIIPGINKLSNQNTREYNINVSQTYYSGDQNIYQLETAKDTPVTSLKINGTYSGNVQVYLVNNETKTRQLVFNSQKYESNIISITGNLVVLKGDPGVKGITLNNVCDETCKIEIDPKNSYLEIVVDKDSTIKIDSISYSQIVVNTPPVQKKNIENIIIINETTKSLSLKGYFSDEEGDTLEYSLSRVPGVSVISKGDTVTFSVPKNVQANYSGFLYVSDGRDEINSNLFQIVVDTKNVQNINNNDVSKPKPDEVPEEKNKTELPLIKTNRTLNITPELTNGTINENISKSNKTIDTIVPTNGTDKNIGEQQSNIGNDILTYSGFAFKVDPELKKFWKENPTSKARIIVKYKQTNTQTIDEYSDLLFAQLDEQAENNPTDFNEKALTAKREELKKQISQLRENPNAFDNVISGNAITGQAISDEINNTEEIKKIQNELREVEKKIATAGVYSELKKRNKIKSIKYDDKLKIELLNANYSDIKSFSLNDKIEILYLDNPVESLVTESMSLIRVPEAKLSSLTTLDGSNVSICFLDTGINPSIIKNPSIGYNFVSDNTNYADDNGHGTSVAYVLYNIVPNARLIVGKVLDANGTGYESTVLSGLQYCEDNNVSIISLSLGSGGYNGYCDNNVVAQKVNELNNKGILVVAATGNDGSDLVKVPACASGALAVGASTKQDGLASFSSWNNNTLILAPGASINTVDLNGNSISKSGTSMAVPFVTSIAGMLKQNDENLTSTILKDKLIHTGQLIEIENKTFSRVDAYNALNNNITNNLTEEGNNSSINNTNETYTIQYTYCPNSWYSGCYCTSTSYARGWDPGQTACADWCETQNGLCCWRDGTDCYYTTTTSYDCPPASAEATTCATCSTTCDGYCQDSACQGDPDCYQGISRSNGQTCTCGAQCTSGNCVGGYCCASASCSTPTCYTGSTCSSGTCAGTGPIADNTQGTGCNTGCLACNGAGSCTDHNARCTASGWTCSGGEGAGTPYQSNNGICTSGTCGTQSGSACSNTCGSYCYNGYSSCQYANAGTATPGCTGYTCSSYDVYYQRCQGGSSSCVAYSVYSDCQQTEASCVCSGSSCTACTGGGAQFCNGGSGCTSCDNTCNGVCQDSACTNDPDCYQGTGLGEGAACTCNSQCSNGHCSGGICQYYRYRMEYSTWTNEITQWDDTPSDNAYCGASTDCVYNGICRSFYGIYDVGGAWGKSYAICYGGGSSDWLNVDYHSSYNCAGAGGTWMNGAGTGDAYGDSYTGANGASSSGYCYDYAEHYGFPTWAGSRLCCCGDDAGEAYRTDDEYVGSSIDWIGSRAACCDAAGDNIDYNNNCVTSGPGGAVATGYSGHDAYAYPYTNGQWLECDYHPSWVSVYCGTSVCQGGWIYMALGDSTGERCGTNGGACGEDANYGCCGDDSGEAYNYKKAYPNDGAWRVNWADDSGDAACCDNANDCVAGNSCKTAYSGVGTGLNPGGVDTTAFCWDVEFEDCDGGSSYCTSNCGLYWTISGDGSIGEYGSATNGGDGTTECCGDDSGENYRTEVCNADCTGLSLSDGTATCCDSSTDCVYDGVCTPHGNGYGSSPRRAWCYSGLWYGGDYGSGECAAIGFTWATGGEGSAFGQYDTGTSTECCGDDSSESYRSGGATHNAARCCSAATDCVNSTNSCVATTTTYGYGDDWYQCSAGTWVDVGCTASSDCSAGQYCNSTSHTCVGLPLCRKANAGYDYTFQSSSEDLYNNCTASFNSCFDVCTRRGPNGNCDGAGACDTNSGTSALTNQVCNATTGAAMTPNYYRNCGMNNASCTDGACSGTQYYISCNAGSCRAIGDTTGAGSATVTANSGASITSTCGIAGTTYCRTSGGNCDPPEYCNGAGTCNSDTKCASGNYYTSGTSCSVGSCRGSAGTCDVAEECNSVVSVCPADSFQSTSTLCNGTYACTDILSTNGRYAYPGSPFSPGYYTQGYCNGTSASCAVGVARSGSTSNLDTNSSACSCQANAYWNIGGDASSGNTACCGNNASEYRTIEIGGSDAPTGYNDGIDACCDVDTDCNYDDTCVALSSVSSPAIPNKAYCGEGDAWYGGDYNTTTCAAIVASGRWNLGFGEVAATTCCGDDNSEYYRSGTAIHNATACCDTATDCVMYNNTCISSGGWYINNTYVYICTAGVWYLNNTPVITSLLLNSTSTSNTTLDNLTLAFTATDANNDLIYNFTDWRRNGTSIAALNLPFNANVSSTASGAVVDYSTYGNHATLAASTAAPTWTTSGKIGGAYTFDAIDDYMSAPAISSITTGTPFTLSAWVYPLATGNYRTIMGYDSTHRLLIGATGQMLSQQSGNFYSAGAGDVPNGAWTHVVYWNNGTVERWYINGAQSGADGAMTVAEWDAAFRIGQYDLVNYKFNGTIDEVKVFRRALSAEQILQEYNAGNAGRSTNTLVSNETVAGDNWTVLVGACDRYSCSTNLSNGVNITQAITTVTCGTTFSTPNMVYSLSGNININNAHCLTVTAANVTINCSGYTITGNNASTTYGVYSTASATTVKNCNIQNFSTGIYFNGATNGTINTTNITTSRSYSGADGRGIYLNTGANYNNIDYTIANSTNNGYGIEVVGSSTNNRITRSKGIAAGSGRGIHVTSDYTTINQSEGISVGGVGIHIGSNYNKIDLSNATSSTAQAMQLYAFGSVGNTLTNSRLITGSGGGQGLNLWSSQCNISNNIIQSSFGVGLFMTGSNTNSIINNTIKGVYGTNGALTTSDTSQNNTIANNTIDGLGGSVAMSLETTGTYGNQFINNTIKNATTLLAILASSGNNLLYWNNFTNGTTFINNANSNNMFNKSGPQGNYYENIASIEIYDTNSDGIGDTGTAYPLSASTWSAKWTGSGTDYGPYTTRTALSCGTLGTANTIYNMSTNLTTTGTCFTVTAANVTINCNGYTITGNNGSGTYGVTTTQQRATIKNCNIQNFSTGIYFNGATNGTIQNTTVTTTRAFSAPNGVGIYLLSSANYNNIVNTSSIAMGHGIYIWGTNYNNITSSNGTSTSTNSGIEISQGTDNIILGVKGNSTSSGSGIRIQGTLSYRNKIFNSTGISQSGHGINLDNSVNTTVISSNGTSLSNTQGIYIQYSYNNTITNSRAATVTGYGIALATSSFNVITNTLTTASSSGIGLNVQSGCENNSFINITATSSSGRGMESYGSKNNLTNSTLSSDSGYGAWLLGNYWNIVDSVIQSNQSAGIIIQNTAYNNLLRTNISGKSASGALQIYGNNDNNIINSSIINGGGIPYRAVGIISGININNTLVNNKILNASTLLYLDSAAGNNLFYWNNFTNGTTFINNNNNTNLFNKSGPQGNYYENIASIEIYDTNSDGWGDAGSAYPLSASTWASKWTGSGTDYGPYTTRTAQSCGTLGTANTIYNLTTNVTSTGTCFTITAANITINCNGYTINYSTAGAAITYGVYSNQFNTTIKNCKIIDGNRTTGLTTRYGIYVFQSSNSTINNNSINVSNSSGIYVWQSNFNNITNNTATSSSGYAIDVTEVNKNSITNNIGTSNSNLGIRIRTVENSTVTNNIGTSNTQYGLTIYATAYLNVVNNTGISTSSSGIYATETRFSNFTNNTATSSSGPGMTLTISSNCTLTGNNITGPSFGFVSSGSNNTIVANRFVSTGSYAIYLVNAMNNTFTNNTINSTVSAAVYLNAESGLNKFYWNNFTSGTPYIDNSNNTNMFNTTISTHAQGNIYAGITAKEIYDSDSDTWGDIGTDYPLSSSTWASKWTGSGTDYGPYTTRTALSCGTLGTAGATYTLVTNVTSTGTCFNITAANITINCNGYTITGNNASNKYGIYSNAINTTVKNCIIKNFTTGIYFNGANYSLIENNTVNSTTGRSIETFSCSGNKIHNNIAKSEEDATIVLTYSNNNSIINFSGTAYGYYAILIDGSNYTTLNNMTTNTIATSGIFINDGSDNVIGNSTLISTSAPAMFTFGASNVKILDSRITSQTSSATSIVNGQNISLLRNNISGNSTSGALELGGSVIGAIIANNTINGGGANKTIFLWIGGYFANVNNTFINNTILNATTLVYMDSTSGANLFYWNNFTNGTTFINNNNNTNLFNTSGPQGNKYEGITSIEIYDTNSDGIGDTGTAYPLSASTWASKWSGSGTDYGPYTTRTAMVCGVLSTANTIYNLSANVSINNANCFNITAANVTLDCRGYNISGNSASGAMGVYVTGANATIKNCRIIGFDYGIQFNTVTRGTVNNVTASTINTFGIDIENSNYVSVNNTVATSANAALLIRSNTMPNLGNTVNNSVFNSTSVGGGCLLIASSASYFNRNNTLQNTRCYSSANYAIGVSYQENILISNVTSYSYSASASTNAGLYITYTNYSTLKNNSFTGYSGIVFDAGDVGNTIANNTIRAAVNNAAGNAIKISSASNNNIIYNNTLTVTSVSADILSVGSGCTGNTFYWNNFTNSGNYYINDAGSSNKYNTTILTVAQGNYYYNVATKNVFDTNSNGWGDAGSDYPLSASTWGTKFTGAGTPTDYAPYTTRIDAPPIIRNSTILPSPAFTNDSLRGYCNATDADGTNLTYDYRWFLNSALNTSGSTIQNFTQGALINVANISSSLLAVGQNWTFECQASDTLLTSSRLNSTTITIQALTPSTPTLISPTNNNYSLTTRQPTFNWTTSTNAAWYEINITSNTVAPPPLGNTTNTNYTPSSELYLDIEPGQGLSTYYNWTVRACNVQNCSPWATKWNFSIMEYLAISLPSSIVSYSSIQPGTIDDTADMSPSPISIRNDGNVRANLTSITFNQTSLWLSGGAGLGTQYFQIKARQSEAGSFNTTGSIMGWTYASQVVNNVIGGLEYNNSKDEAYLDTLIEAPSQEPPGNRSISISFNWVSYIPN